MALDQRLLRNPVVLLGVGAGLLVAALALIWISLSSREAAKTAHTQTQPAQATQQIKTVSIQTAARDILRGHALTAEDVGTTKVVAPAPEGAIAENVDVTGHVAETDIPAGQILMSTALGNDLTSAGLAALVPDGFRAYSIKVTEDDILGGFLKVGDHVDIYVTLPGNLFAQQQVAGEKTADRSRAALLLQNIQVLAVGQKLSTPGAEADLGARTIALAANPDQVARLALAQRLGELSLAIRKPGDDKVADARLIDLQDMQPSIAGGKSSGGDGATQSAGHRVEVLSGASQTTVYTTK